MEHPVYATSIQVSFKLKVVPSNADLSVHLIHRPTTMESAFATLNIIKSSRTQSFVLKLVH